MNPLDAAAREVLGRHYPGWSAGGLLAALGNRGGFSGARLWRVQGTAGPMCLRAWPPDGPSPDRLQFMHQLMRQARAAGLAFVPAVVPTRANTTWVEHAGRLWDLTKWMPGRADFKDRPDRKRLEAACAALALLHRAWAEATAPQVGCPAGVLRRLECARGWEELLRTGWRPAFAGGDLDPVQPWAREAWRLLLKAMVKLSPALAGWGNRSVPLQPCLCDIHHDHVLFEGERVSGVVDYGSVKVDSVAVDLARLLGSLAPDDETLHAAGICSYEQVRPLAGEEKELVPVLDQTGTCLAAVNWLTWLYREGKEYEDRTAVARRLEEVVCRMVRWEEIG
jgi:homoserine kinase type II